MAIKEVMFDKYCPLCEDYDKSEDEDPCYDCLNQGWNEDSHKPIMFKEKGSDNNDETSRIRKNKGYFG